MKKILLLLVSVLSCSHAARAQGTVQFQNTTLSTAILTNTPTGRGKVFNSPQYMCYGLFYSDATTGGVSNNLMFATAVYNAVAPAGPGVIAGNNSFPLAGTSPGQQAWLMVLGWDG